MARRGLIAALLGHSQGQGCSAFPFQVMTRNYSNKLFVGGLSFRTDEDAVRRAFSQHGEVVEVKLIQDRETGRPKGFGFVTFESEADAETARSKMIGQLLDGRVIRVDKATSSRPPLPSSGFSGGSSSASVGGSFGSPTSSALPPVAEDWGTIPSNIVDLGAGASPTNATPPSNGFGIDTSKPFDSSSFGQAAASWPTSTPVSPSSIFTQTTTSTLVSSSGSSTFGSSASFSGNSFGSASTFSSITSGAASNTPSSSPSTSWSGGTPPPSSSASSVSTSSNSFSSSSFGSAASTSGTPFGSTSAAQSSTIGTTNCSISAVPKLGAKPFDSSTFGSASGNAIMAGLASTSMTANASWVNTGSSSSVTAPLATITESNTTMISSSTGTGTNVAGTADYSKPLESTAVAGALSASTTPVSSVPPAHPLSSPALTSSGSFDFSNFSFNSSSYRDNDPPLPRRRPRPRPRPATQTMSSDFNSSTASIMETRSPFGSNNQFAETSIPKPKGTEVDFGLLNITAPLPPGMRPQGVFDIYLPDDLPEIPPPEPKPKPKPMSLSMFPHRQLPALDLLYHTPEADNWSEIGKDPPKYDLSTLFPSMGELIKKDKEFHWDPFDFDPDFKLPPEEKVVIIDSDYDDPM
ncbi:hypothetical protein L7F22_018548 [Adiantum nelumboides]|nr:hypothetical protein [Adiantum nelumboides]